MSNATRVESNYMELIGLGPIEVDVDHEASTYMVENYDMILRQAVKMGVDPVKVEDLVQDVYISLLDGENNGNGYSIEHSRSGSVITVADFVFGRLKGYSKNSRYRAGVERHGASTVENSIEIVCASSSSSDTSDLDSMQRAYMMAPSYDGDEMENTEILASLRQDLELCLDFNEVVGFDLRNLFTSIDQFSGEFGNSLFEKLSKALNYHTDFGDAFKNVLMAAKINRVMFEDIVAEYC